jgi:hypothetical protein
MTDSVPSHTAANIRGQMTPEDAHEAFRLTVAGSPQAKEAIQLMELLYDEIEKRVPTDLPGVEREARIDELLTEDSRLNEMAARMDLLFKGDLGGSVS